MEGPPDGPRRQRWWCEPKTGEKHRFRETLPRIVGHDVQGHTCPECASRLAPWEGQPAPRLYGYAVRDIAWALARVSEGLPYRSAAAEVRVRANRPLETEVPRDAKGKRLGPAANDHGQLVSDWVDVYAPVIWDAYAPTAWPKEAILDEDEMRYSVPGTARGQLAFLVLAVMGRTRVGRPYVVSIEAVPRATTAAWAKHLKRLDGAPEVYVTDGGGAVAVATGKAWPSAEARRCEFHLSRNLREALPSKVARDLQDPLHASLRGAVSSLGAWEDFRRELNARGAKEPGFMNSMTLAAKLDRVVQGQLPTRSPFGVNSTGPLEQFYRDLENNIGDRAGRMTNKRRADALLMLLAARNNRWGSEQEWAELIRKHLTTAKGMAREQRQHTDPKNAPSLRC